MSDFQATNSAFGPIKTAKVNGTTLAYREEGEGDPVVFVHGGLSDLRAWEQQLPEIGRSYRAITYSRRYARPNEDISPDVDDQMLPHVDDLAAFLKEIGAVPAHVVGNSWGAFISLLTAIRYPDLVRSLVLEEPPVVTLLVRDMPPRPLEMMRLIVTQPRMAMILIELVTRVLLPFQKAVRGGDDARALKIFGSWALGRAEFASLSETRLEQMRANFSALRAQILGEGFPPLSEDEVRGIRAPTLLLTGEHSPSGLLRLTDRLEPLLPVVERLEIPRASHAIHEDNAPAVNAAILDFIGRLDG